MLSQQPVLAEFQEKSWLLHGVPCPLRRSRSGLGDKCALWSHQLGKRFAAHIRSRQFSDPESRWGPNQSGLDPLLSAFPATKAPPAHPRPRKPDRGHALVNRETAHPPFGPPAPESASFKAAGSTLAHPPSTNFLKTSPQGLALQTRNKQFINNHARKKP